MGRVAIYPFLLLLMFNFVSCNFIDKMAVRAEKINNFERVSLKLAQKNRLLQAKINQLEFQLEKSRARSEFLALQVKHPKKSVSSVVKSRTPASIKGGVDSKSDLVKQETYQWSDTQLKAAAIREYEQKNFEKAAQFFQILVRDFPNSGELTDQTLFQAGISAYHSGKHYDWSISTMDSLAAKYPESNYYLSAKAWSALAYLQRGDEDTFWKVVEEFRKKYRNTVEWKLMSKHYDRLATKYQR
jgi:outer membrane protein assembly factor BamD (BamD/ComL family)